MKTLMPGAAAALILASALHAQVPQQKVLLGHAATPTVSVRLMAGVGDIRLVGWDRDSVELSGVVPTGARVELFAGSATEQAKGVKMYVEAPPEQTGREGKLTLRVPRGARVWIKTGSADVDCAGVTGGVDLNVVGGSITVHGNPKEVRAESMDGAVIIDGSPEWLRAKTATGDITMRGGIDVGASTISGTIRASGGEVERAKLEATTGAIAFSSTMARGASVELETHSGPIDIGMPPSASAEIDIATITGAIDNQRTAARPSPGREGRGMTLQISSGMGSARLVVRSFKGTVQLRAK